MEFTPFMLHGRPDQTAYQLNVILDRLDDMRNSIVVKSKDGENVIIIGEGHPIDPNTNKPYPFGIRKYIVRGDRLELEHDYE